MVLACKKSTIISPSIEENSHTITLIGTSFPGRLIGGGSFNRGETVVINREFLYPYPAKHLCRVDKLIPKKNKVSMQEISLHDNATHTLQIAMTLQIALTSGYMYTS